MKTLDLARRGRMRGLGEQVADALLLADAVEEHDRRMGPREPAGEHSPVVGEQLVRHPMPGQRSAERRAHRARIGSLHDAGTRAESRMVVDAGEQRHHGGVGEPEAHHVHLPELHRTRPLPAPVHRALATPSEGLDELVAVQQAIDAGRSWNPGHALAAQLVDQAPRPPARMVTAQVTHHALHLRRDLVRTPRRSPQTIDQPRHPQLAVPPQPRVHGLPAHSMSHCHLGDGQTILEHLQDDPVALFHHVQLHKHEPGPSDGAQSLRTSGPEGGRLCQASGGRAAHRQASLGPAMSSICRTFTRTSAAKTVSAM